MSKDVVLSIKPEWVKLILSGEKTLELRRSRPRQDTPFTVYIYETRGDEINRGKGKVVGEFLCDRIQKDINPSMGLVDVVDQRLSCIPANQIIDYARHRKRTPQLVYWWHVKDVKKYDKPKELCEYGLKSAPQSWAYVDAALEWCMDD